MNLISKLLNAHVWNQIINAIKNFSVFLLIEHTICVYLVKTIFSGKCEIAVSAKITEYLKVWRGRDHILAEQT